MDRHTERALVRVVDEDVEWDISDTGDTTVSALTVNDKRGIMRARQLFHIGTST